MLVQPVLAIQGVFFQNLSTLIALCMSACVGCYWDWSYRCTA